MLYKMCVTNKKELQEEWKNREPWKMKQWVKSGYCVVICTISPMGSRTNDFGIMHSRKWNKIILLSRSVLSCPPPQSSCHHCHLSTLWQTSEELLITLNRVSFPASIFFLANFKNKWCLGNYPRKNLWLTWDNWQ